MNLNNNEEVTLEWVIEDAAKENSLYNPFISGTLFTGLLPLIMPSSYRVLRDYLVYSRNYQPKTPQKNFVLEKITGGLGCMLGGGINLLLSLFWL